MPFEDTPQQQEQRRKLVAELSSKGITDQKVLNAVGQIPRHLFMPPAIRDKAYIDKAFPIGEEQTISQPYTVAYQTQLLDLKSGEKVLEIGTGSAYQTVVLATLGAVVYTIERQKKLFDKNRRFEYLKRFPNLHCCYGDGFLGWPEKAPFDKIIITAAPAGIPPALIEQVKTGGYLVAPIGPAGLQRMVRLTGKASGESEEEVFDKFSFVPMLTGTQ